jgi:DNA polymerase-3 subunit epsilon
MVNPDRPMAATEIHGITDGDVADAPRFFEVGGDFLRAISGCVVASYNIYFDIGFLSYELLRIGIRQEPPHICLMYLRPLLELGKRCSLSEACKEAGISLPHAHQSSADALASAQLWAKYLHAMEARALLTFGDLASKKQYKFFSSLRSDPLSAPTPADMPPLAHPKSRSIAIRGGEAAGGAGIKPAGREVGLHRYWDELTTVLSDLEISRMEIKAIEDVKREFELSEDEVRGMHARIFADLLIQTSADKVIDSDERDRIRRIHRCLKTLGWAPGE